MKQFAQALRSKGVSDKVGRFAVSLFVLSFVMAIVAVMSVAQVRGELTTIFDNAGQMRGEQLASRAMLGALVDTEVALLRYAMAGDEGHLNVYREQAKRFDEAARHYTKLRSGKSSDYESFDNLAQTSFEGMQAASEALAGRGASVADVRASFASFSPERARTAQEQLEKIISARLDEVRSRGRMTVTLLLAALSFLAFGLVLLSFAQLRDFVIRTAGFLRSEERAAREIGSLEQVVAKSRQEIEAVHRQLAITLHSAGVQVFTLDATGTINWVADGRSRLTRLNMAPCSLADLLTGEARADVLKQVTDVIHLGRERSIEAQIASSSSTYDWVRFHFVPQPESDPDHALGCAIDISELKRREQNTFWLMRELSHRSKNLLAIVQSMAGLTARSTQSTELFLKRFANRLRALAASHDLLVDADYSGAPLGDLIRSQLFELSELIGDRVQLDGPDIMLRAEAAQNLGMALHELYANAVTHGALRSEGGRLDIRWSVSREPEGDVLLIDWTEIATDPVPSLSPSGFGETLIKTNLYRALEGDVTLDHQPTGTVCHIRLPLARLRVDGGVTDA